MHHEDYGKNQVYDAPNQAYINRMRFVRECGCNTLMITGTAEPQQNMPFIYELLRENAKLPQPFYNIELQTTGSNIDEGMIEQLAKLGLTTISFSISSFDLDRNRAIVHCPTIMPFNYYEVNKWAKKYNLITRASINLTDEFKEYAATEYFDWAIQNDFDQITFRVIYANGNSEQAQWCHNHSFPSEKYDLIVHYIKNHGVPIMKLPFGRIKYSVRGISTVVDDDCMAKDSLEDMKYAILRPNCHLYSRWDDKGSLIF